MNYKKPMIVIILILAGIIALLVAYYVFAMSVVASETDAIYTKQGWSNFFSGNCYNGAGGNSYCDPCARIGPNDCKLLYPEVSLEYESLQKKLAAAREEHNGQLPTVFDQFMFWKK